MVAESGERGPSEIEKLRHGGTEPNKNFICRHIPAIPNYTGRGDEAERPMGIDREELRALKSEARRTGYEDDDVRASQCFIATAVYGGGHPRVSQLRKFRDLSLTTHPVGRALVAGYYRLSPGVARYLQGHPVATSVARAVLDSLPISSDGNGYRK